MIDSIESLLTNLINQAQDFGLSVGDVINAREFLSNHEYGLSFDTIITQIYEYDIPINSDYYDLISNIGQKLKIDSKEYKFVKELIE